MVWDCIEEKHPPEQQKQPPKNLASNMTHGEHGELDGCFQSPKIGGGFETPFLDGKNNG